MSGSGQANKVWKTDGSGNPAWRDDANTTYSAGTNIQISGTTISATDTKYSAGTNLTLSGTTFSVKDSPAFTGTPTTPTAAASTNNTQIASTAFVQAAINAKLPNSVSLYANKTSQSVPNASETTIALGISTNKKGLLIGYLYVNWGGKSGGYRQVRPKIGSQIQSGLKWDCSTAATQHMKIPVFQDCNAGEAISAVCEQNSGAELTIANMSFYGAVFG